MIGYFVLFKRALHAASRPEVLENLRPTLKVFMEALDVKMVFGFTEVSVFFCYGGLRRLTWWIFWQGEPHVISAFTELVVKLNDNAFRPLFRRMHDWAFADEKGAYRFRLEDSLRITRPFFDPSQRQTRGGLPFVTCILPCSTTSRYVARVWSMVC